MPEILFICKANQYRSPIAEACFRRETIKHKQDALWQTSSTGTWTKDGLPAMPDAIIQAEKLGLDIRTHRSRVVTESILEQADLILVMEQGQKEALHSEYTITKGKTYLLTEVTLDIPYSIPDPVENSDTGDVSKEICDLISANHKKILHRTSVLISSKEGES